MEILTEHRIEIASLLARLVLGILFFFQGYEKIFRIGLRQTEDAMTGAMFRTALPRQLVRFITILSSFIELCAGLTLFAGLFLFPSLVLLSANLLLVVLAMSLRESLWDMRYVWPRLALLVFLWSVPLQAHRFSVDFILNMHEFTGLP